MSIEAYRMDGLSPLDHMAAENVLLETYVGSSTLLLFYVNEPSVIIGRNQNPWREAPSSSRLPLYRRVSGGGAVYHDPGNLNWSFIVPRSLHSQDDELSAMAAAVSAQGFEIGPGPRGGLYCGGSSVLAGRKVSGTARRFGARNVLHHGTLLVDTDMAGLRASLGGIETCEDASIASVPASPLNLTEVNPETGIACLIDGIASYFSAAPVRAFSSMKVDPSLVEAEKKRLSSPEWIYEATPPFSVRLTAGEVDFSCRVEKGRILHSSRPELVGRSFSFSIIEKSG